MTNVKKFKIGDKVYSRIDESFVGTMAEYVISNASDVALIPSNLGFDESASIPLADYPQLKELGWHIQGLGHLSPMEAHSIYERNRRFLAHDKLTDSECQLIDALRVAFEGVVS